MKMKLFKLILVITALLGGLSNAETITYMHTDALGSPVAATDESGNVLWREHYSPFGAKLDNSEQSKGNDVGYTGHQFDNDTGLVYMQARYYDPLIGRFYSNDPVGYTAANPVMSFNRYMYVNNNPYKYTDPSGQILETAWDVVNIGIGVASLSENISAGNWGAASLDAVGVVVDTAAAIVPVVPGGAGTAIKLSRTASSRGKQIGNIIDSNGSTTASSIKNKAESLGFTPTQTANVPLKFVDENNVPRVTIKAGSDRAPGSSGAHVELKDSTGQRVSPAGVPTTRKSPENHTPIINDL